MDSSQLSPRTRNHKFRYLGHRWRFLQHELELETPTDIMTMHRDAKEPQCCPQNKFRARSRLVREVVLNVEKQCIDERLLDHLDSEVQGVIQDYAVRVDGEDGVDELNDDDSLSKPFSVQAAAAVDADFSKSFVTDYEAEEVATSIRHIRMFYAMKDSNQIDREVPGPICIPIAGSNGTITTDKRSNVVAFPSIDKSRRLSSRERKASFAR